MKERSLKNLALMSNQKRLWIVSKQDSQNPFANILLTYHLRGVIDKEILSRSLRILFERNHTLFSVFRQNEGLPVIDILVRPVEIEFIDFSGSADGKPRDSILSFAGDDSRKAFDIEKGPLYRLFLLKEKENSYFFHATIHHLIFDGFSRRAFVMELSSIYTSLVNGIEISPASDNFHSYDYAELESKEGTREKEKELTEFWKQYLSDCPPELKFPYDFPRKVEPTGYGRREHFSISEKHSLLLNDLSKKNDATLFNTLLSVLGLLLTEYTGENDICIGVPVSNRRLHPGLENIFGLFVNTAVVRLKHNEGDSFRESILKTRESVRNSVKHSALPFEKIVEAVNPVRLPGVNPFFQVSLSWINMLTVPMNLAGTMGKKVTVKTGVSPFDITFYMWEEGGHIEGEIEYNIDLFKRETITRLKANFISLAQILAENPEFTPKDASEAVSMVTIEDKKLIEEVNNTKKQYPGDSTIISLFREQVALYPDKTAVIYKDNYITYSQLGDQSNRLSHTLRASGVVENMPVGIICDKSDEIITGILAIMKAGGIYLPIDPDYPIHRMNIISADSGCRIVLFQDKYMDLEIENVIKINLNSAASYGEDNSEIQLKSISTDAAYIMYTSGTTGKPKGILIPHQGVVRLVRNTNFMTLTADDRILLTGAMVFDATTFEIWGALLNGGTLYIVDKETILSPKNLGKELIDNDITVLWLTSALLTQIAESRTDIFRKLKYLLSGGDVLSAPHINKVRRSNPDLKVLNCYGPTENTTFSTTYLIEKDFESNIPIGKPVSNSTAFILDRHLKYLPIGSIGELYVGGDGLTLGYLNRDELNRKSFFEHPQKPGERLYKTGDLARWLPDGNIEFHGRVDNQIKIRGFRVELEEIASVISELNGIIETVIKPVKIQEGDIRLVAFMNVNKTFSMNTSEITRQIKKKLPPYMVPTIFKVMHGFPSTINGKTDLVWLNADINEVLNRKRHSLRKLTPTEKKISDIWCEALKITDISPTDNFFDIGGNSLISISVLAKIESAFGIFLKTRVFFHSPRIEDLAVSIDIAVLENQPKYVADDCREGVLCYVEGEI